MSDRIRLDQNLGPKLLQICKLSTRMISGCWGGANGVGGTDIEEVGEMGLLGEAGEAREVRFVSE